MAWIHNWHKPDTDRGKRTAVQYVTAMFGRYRQSDAPWVTVLKLLFRRAHRGQEQELLVELKDDDLRDIVLTIMRNVVIMPNCPVKQTAVRFTEDRTITDEQRIGIAKDLELEYGVSVPLYPYLNWHSLQTCALCKNAYDELERQFEYGLRNP